MTKCYYKSIIEFSFLFQIFSDYHKISPRHVCKCTQMNAYKLMPKR